jgi:hypothetical protein
LKTEKEKNQMAYKCNSITITADISTETTKGRSTWIEVF